MRTQKKRTFRYILHLAATLAMCSAMTLQASAQIHSQAENLLVVGDSIVRRIMPKPISDSAYVSTDYTEIHFRSNKADLDVKYMENKAALEHLDIAIDSIGLENITAIEIVGAKHPDGRPMIPEVSLLFHSRLCR